ncbi:MAG: carbohydrate kinase family protein [Brevinematia bacterium]
MTELVCLGEILIDFTPVRVNEDIYYEKNPGGAPANVAVAFSKLGGKSSFIGMVGNDDFGRFLKAILEKNKLDTRGLCFTDKANTTLAFVSLTESGERSFTFYRKPGADMLLSKRDLNLQIIKETKIFHFGSLSMTNKTSEEAALKALNFARKNKKIVSFDPNLRAALWNDLNVARRKIKSVINRVDILKISEDELYFITSENDIKKGLDLIEKTYRTPIILLTMGEKGALYSFNGKRKSFKSYKTNAIDTTGAGDAFLGGFLFLILKEKFFENYLPETIDRAVSFANATAAITVSRRGAIPAMPEYYEVIRLMEACKPS